MLVIQVRMDYYCTLVHNAFDVCGRGQIDMGVANQSIISYTARLLRVPLLLSSCILTPSVTTQQLSSGGSSL